MLNESHIREILIAFLDPEIAVKAQVIPRSEGLIHQSLEVIYNSDSWILQRVNNEVFKNPHSIQRNTEIVLKAFESDLSNLVPLTPMKTRVGDVLFELNGEIWRLFETIQDCDNFEFSPSADHSYEAAFSLAKFHQILKRIPSDLIQDPLPDFLNFNKRWDAFKLAQNQGSHDRVRESEWLIEELIARHDLLLEYNEVLDQSKKYIIHADPKISNFLFYKGRSVVKAIIDWDTIMNGPILYDFGDMVRSGVNQSKEDEIDAESYFNEEQFEAISQGFVDGSKGVLSDLEHRNMALAAKTVIWIQSIRFITDYLLNDEYYQTDYPEQNLNRAFNQLNVLKEFEEYLNS